MTALILTFGAKALNDTGLCNACLAGGNSIVISTEECGGQKMVPHVNKWSPLDGAHEKKVTVIVTKSELSLFIYPYAMIVQPSSSRVNSMGDLLIL